MDQPAPNYHAEFFKSPHHAVLALATIGVGFLSAQLLGLIAGTVAYVLGWIYLPDLPFFRKWVEKRRSAGEQEAEAQKVAEFLQRRDALLRSLSSDRRERYAHLTQVCRDIEHASTDSPLAVASNAGDPRLRKLDELMWTFLRLLGIEESLERFLDTERREDIPALLQEAEREAKRLTAEVEAQKDKGSGPAQETRQRFLNSRLERLEVLRKRQQRCEQGEANLALVRSEQERLEQQIKLIRADAVATKNADSLSARIDATVEHLDQTNKWLSEMDEFKDLVGDLPATEARLGYQAAPAVPTPPPIIGSAQIRRQPPLRQRQT
jgi:hypothetical protein